LLQEQLFLAKRVISLLLIKHSNEESQQANLVARFAKIEARPAKAAQILDDHAE
jgi:hypothetical protein